MEPRNIPPERGRGHVQIFHLDGYGSWLLLQDSDDPLSFSTEDSGRFVNGVLSAVANAKE